MVGARYRGEDIGGNPKHVLLDIDSDGVRFTNETEQGWQQIKLSKADARAAAEFLIRYLDDAKWCQLCGAYETPQQNVARHYR